MSEPGRASPLLPYLALALFFAASVAVRPLFPTAETRYLTVAWEMFVNGNFLVPSLNFAPYYHKPPLFFWLIDLAWAVFGVHRAVAVGVMYVFAAATVYLTVRLARAMFPRADGLTERLPWLMVGSVVFAIYATLIYFDVFQTVFVLAFMLALLAFARGGGLLQAVLAGLFIGLGVLAKGPVMLVHVVWPVVLYPLWRNPDGDLSNAAFFKGCGVIVAAGFVPVIAWLGPVLALADSDFLYNLLWKQSAGRVSGSLDGAHPRPFYYYLQFAPLLLLPWIFSPGIYRGRPLLRVGLARATDPDAFRMLRLLVLWFLGVFVTFSLISGKQPHYLVPELPLIVILLGYFMTRVSLPLIRGVAVAMLLVFVAAQMVASFTFFERLDLAPLANMVRQNSAADWAFVGEYEGEVTFLARLERPIKPIGEEAVADWLAAHPAGYAIYDTAKPLSDFTNVVFSQPSDHGRYIVVGGAEAKAP